MINPKELRIDNYVEYKGQMLPVLAIDNEAFLSELKYKGLVRLPDKLPNGMVFGSSGIWCAKINPIPITPEILVSCGFEKCESDDVEERGIYTIQVDNNHSLYFDPTEDPQWYISLQWNNNHYKNSFWAQPEYLHQLQNLIHSLTNQELTFKTTTHD